MIPWWIGRRRSYAYSARRVQSAQPGTSPKGKDWKQGFDNALGSFRSFRCCLASSTHFFSNAFLPSRQKGKREENREREERRRKKTNNKIERENKWHSIVSFILKSAAGPSRAVAQPGAKRHKAICAVTIIFVPKTYITLLEILFTIHRGLKIGFNSL